MAIDLYAQATIEPGPDITLELWAAPEDDQPLQAISLAVDELPLPYDGRLDILKAAVNRFYQFSPELRRKLGRHGFRLAVWTDVPRQSGLGGSSLLVLLALGGLRALYELEPRAHNDYLLAELAQKAEAQELGITCGYADRYVPLFGGLAYVDYRGKLHQAEPGQEPLATYERLDHWVDDLPLVVVTTGVQHDSGDVHGRMRPRYLVQWAEWKDKGGPMPPLVQLMFQAWATAWRGKMALLAGDLETVGELMNENHRLVDAMMSQCGFEDGAGWANNLFIQTALQQDALGAKLTGAGGGGSVFALAHPAAMARLIRAWERQIADAGLSQARIYRPRVARHGLTVMAQRNE